jgi:glutamate carboxypeptidase
MSDEILTYFEERSDYFLGLLMDLIRREVPNGDASASREFATHYRGLLEACGASCRQYVTTTGVHLVADWPGDGDSTTTPDIVLVTHSDTVWPEGEVTRRPPSIKDGRLSGPGAYDMRAGLMLAVAVISYLDHASVNTSRAIRVFVSADEESGSLEAKEFLTREVPLESICLVLEPPGEGGALKIERKGVGIYQLAVEGRAGHAGINPDDASSAIDELVEQIVAIRTLRDTERGVSINIGEIEGGIASNVIADHARASVDVRFIQPEDGDAVDRALRTLQPQLEGTRLELTGGIAFPPMIPRPETLDLANKAIERAGKLGVTFTTSASGGGSDGSYLSAIGCRVLDGLGIDGDGAHALDEHIIVDRFPFRAALVTHLALELE